MDDDQKIKDYIEKQIKSEYRSEKPNFKEKAADNVAHFGGSWRFIFIFIVFFASWIAFNTFILVLDPYPFILLNLILSCLAVFQAPFILMSQNRMSEIDRKREERSYKVNMKAELEIQNLHDKVDKLMKHHGLSS